MFNKPEMFEYAVPLTTKTKFEREEIPNTHFKTISYEEFKAL